MSICNLRNLRNCNLGKLTTERYSATPSEVVIRKAKEVVRGWAGYFYYRNCTKAMSTLKEYLLYRLRVYLRRKHHFQGFGATRRFRTDIITTPWECTRCPWLPHGTILWKPLKEDNWKAVLGKTERLVWWGGGVDRAYELLRQVSTLMEQTINISSCFVCCYLC